MRSLLLGCLTSMTIASGAMAQSTAAQLASVFEGQPDEATVIREVSRTLRAFKQPISDSNIMLVGRMAVVGYSETGAPELQIIDCAGDIGEQRKVEAFTMEETLALCSVMVANKNARQ